MTSVRIVHDCRIELNNADLRATPARIAVMKLLENTHNPLDVATVKKYLDKEKIDTDAATVFRIMNMFTHKGITKQISFKEGKFRYELASKQDHHHLVCINCSKVEDFFECLITSIEKKINRKKKFLVKSHMLEFYGVCRLCQP